ncbi:transglycosylase family protein [Streptomyces sp. NPDC087420]|uniref:transglycosylase family protein n=1 Tax=Streptomyces sp. NPDC087420 TaxID=3365785 RepID=UPI00383661F0
MTRSLVSRLLIGLAVLSAASFSLFLTAGPATAASVSTWDKVAVCESGGNWSTNTGNGFYGGLQFTLATWNAYGGDQYAAFPNQATKQEQILTAEKVLAVQGESAWPTCGPQAGLGSDSADPYPPVTPPPPHGSVWDRTRSASGTWAPGATMIDGNGNITAAAASALPDGTVHVQALVNGEVYDRTRSTTGSWAANQQIDADGDIFDTYAAGLPDGTLHVGTLV